MPKENTQAGRHWSLYTRIVVGMVMIVLTVSLGAGALIRHQEDRYLSERLERYLQQIGHLVAAPISYALVSGEQSALQTQVFQLADAYPTLYAVRILGEDKLPLFSWQRADKTPQRYLELYEQNIQRSSGQVAYLQIQLNVGELRQDIHEHADKTSLVYIGWISLVGFMVWLLVWSQVLRPLKQLSRQMNHLAGGGTLPSNDPYRGDVLENLGASVSNLGEVMEALQFREQELEDARLQLHAVLQGAAEGIIAINHLGRVVLANRAAKQVFRHENSLNGIDIGLLLPRDSIEMLMDSHLEEHQTLQLMGRRSDGAEVPLDMQCSWTPVGTQFLFILAFHDISAQQANQHALESAREQAEAASQAKTEFLSMMSHEIRTPMNAVLGVISLLQDGSLNREQRHFLEMAEESGQALLTIISDILDYSKVEAGHLSLEVSEWSPRAIVDSVVEMLAPRAQEKGIELSSVVQPQVPDRIFADSGRFRQILLNLLVNAIKFTERGGVRVELAVIQDQTQGASMLECQVIDTGVGISESDQPHLFDAFFQISGQLGEHHEGTGLGLAISQKLVTCMGGTIGLHSKLDKGSNFWFSIPLLDTPAAYDDEEGLKVHSVLVAAANPMTCRALGRQCRLWGMAVREAINLTAAENAADEKVPDVVLADAAWVERLQERLPERCRVITLVDFDQQVHLQQMKEDGIHAFLRKPVRVGSQHRWLAAVLEVVCCNEVTAALAAPVETGADAPPPQDAVVRRILLVEDSQANRVVANSMLQRRGYLVDLVENGRQALEAVQHVGYDLVLMDIQMPVMNGYEATTAIRQLPAPICDLPIIALTANATPADRQSCLDIGMNDHLPKPINRLALYEVIDHWIGDSTGDGSTDTYVHEEKKDDNEPWLEPAALAQLEADTDASLIPEIMGIFVKELEIRLENLQSALDTEEWSRVEHEAHGIKSSSGTFAAMRLREAAKEVEDACKRGDLRQVPEIAKALFWRAEATISAIEALNK